jgi:hypothetical protein
MTGPRPPQDGDDEPGATPPPSGEYEQQLPPAGVPPEELSQPFEAPEPPAPERRAPERLAPEPPAAEPPPADQFVDVNLGDLFREVRQNRALTLAEVERDTRINRDYLEALEQERYELLPAPVYTRGFVRAYARHLGLNEEGALSLLPDELPTPIGLEPIAGLRGGSRASLRSVNLPLLAAVAGALGLLAIVALSLIWLRDDGGTAADPLPVPVVTATASSAVTGTVTPDARSVATVPPFELGETPNFIGVDSETAQVLLTTLGLRFVVIEVDTSDAPAGTVFAQTPEPGDPIDASGDVTLIVSKGISE